MAQVGTTTSTTSSSRSESVSASWLAYSACMRSHGLPNFPDPGPDGGIKLGTQTTGSSKPGLNPDSAPFTRAQRACRTLVPAGGPPDPQEQQTLLAFAHCMRSHGVAGFPDPRPGEVQPMPPGVDTHSPQFSTAMQECRKLVPGLFGASGSATP